MQLNMMKIKIALVQGKRIILHASLQGIENYSKTDLPSRRELMECSRNRCKFIEVLYKK